MEHTSICEKCKVIFDFDGHTVIVFCPLHAAAEELAEAAKAQVDEWHSNNRNFERVEPRSLKLAKAAIAKVEGK